MESIRQDSKDSIDYKFLTASQKRYVDKLNRDHALKNKKSEEQQLLEKFEQGRIRNLPKV
jgi:hypothetical protein|tara:strand:+ start:507 stop:686 length:180 start_codon:yes stop_codon:yes gene_type:complete